MKNMLITGGAGFIGCNFIRHILQTNTTIQIINIDKLTYAGNLANLQKLPDDSRHRFIQGDICDREFIARLFKEYEIDTIVHFAAESHVDRSIASPYAFVETNVMGTFNLLEKAKESNITRFHHISTDEVYGSLQPQDPAFTEKSPYNPRSPYSSSKAGSDHLVMAYYHTYGLPVTISNCSNNYGPYQHQEKFIPTVIRSCLTQKPIPIYGNGKNIRDWLYVEDHCKAIMTILQHGKMGECYNVGGDNEIENLDLAIYICDLLDELRPSDKPYKSLLQFVTDRLGHDFRYAINRNKIKCELGWEPSESFQSGMMKTLHFYIEHYSVNSTVCKSV